MTWELDTNGGGGTEIDLARFDEDYAGVDVRTWDPVPDGDYQVAVERVELTTARSSGNPMLKWELRILAPSAQGRRLWRHNMIVSPDNLRWLKTDLHLCGLDLEKLSDLPQNLDRLLDVKLDVTVRSRGEDQSVYLNRRIVQDQPGASLSGTGPADAPPF